MPYYLIHFTSTVVNDMKKMNMIDFKKARDKTRNIWLCYLNKNVRIK